MKRVLTFLAIMLLPLSVWAMTPVTDSDLSNVTGQAGVNINANITMDVSIGTMAWGDADGLGSVYNPWNSVGTGSGGYGTDVGGGYVGVSNFNITNLSITARIADSWNGYCTLMLKPITIDVATAGASGIVTTTAASYGPADAINSLGGVTTENIPAGKTFVRFGLGALLIKMDALDFDVSLSPRVTTTATAGSTPLNMTYGDTAGTGQNLGEVALGGMVVAINPWSYVDIYQSTTDASGTSGVAFAVNVTIDHFELAYMSWGDKDGLDVGNYSTDGSVTQEWFGTDTDAGYVGLNQFMINGPIAINGTVAIDIATINSGAYAQVPPFTQMLLDNSANLNKQLGFLQWMCSTGAANTSFAQYNTSLAAGAAGAYTSTIAAATTKYASAFTTLAASVGTTAATQIVFDKYSKTDGEGVVMEALKDAARAYGAAIYAGAIADSTYELAPTTVVHIAFPTNMIIDVRGSITGDVVLSSAANLGYTGSPLTKASLGDIYVSGFVVNMHAGSWVDIWAH